MRGRQYSCCFTGHRPGKLPWGYAEEDPRCRLLKERIADAVEGAYQRRCLHFSFHKRTAGLHGSSEGRSLRGNRQTAPFAPAGGAHAAQMRPRFREGVSGRDKLVQAEKKCR